MGKLSHACKVMWAGCMFLQRMIELSAKAKKIDHWLIEFRISSRPGMARSLSPIVEHL